MAFVRWILPPGIAATTTTPPCVPLCPPGDGRCAACGGRGSRCCVFYAGSTIVDAICRVGVPKPYPKPLIHIYGAMYSLIRGSRDSHFFFCESSLLRDKNHSTLQRGMLHTAAERGTATESDRGEGGVPGRVTWGLGRGRGGFFPDSSAFSFSVVREVYRVCRPQPILWNENNTTQRAQHGPPPLCTNVKPHLSLHQIYTCVPISSP